jgi:hypothetical protein
MADGDELSEEDECSANSGSTHSERKSEGERENDRKSEG